jgi:hypothetical protein
MEPSSVAITRSWDGGYFWSVHFRDTALDQTGTAETIGDAIGFVQHAVEDAHGEGFNPASTVVLR